jgi:hypothetical protein
MTSAALLRGPAAVAAADAVVADLIAAAKRRGERARLTKAPAGAGKTGAVTRLVDALADDDANVGVIAQTNAQAFDLVDRIARTAPARTVAFLPASSIVLPGATEALPNVVRVAANNLGSAPVIVATADKWAHSAAQIPAARFDAGVVDEGYQMPSAKLLRVADLFPMLDFLGDPAQLDPFSTVDDSRWRGLSVNPVLNAVDALLAYHGDAVPQRSLPVTRRLPVTAADVIRRIFYPDLAFGPASEPGDRELLLRARGIGGGSIVPAAWRSAAERGWAYVELPHRLVVQPDVEIVELLANLVEGLFASKPAIRDEKHRGGIVDLVHDRVAVGVAHRNQRAAVSIALQRRGLGGVVVDTANRVQGREFDVVLVWHPLAGRRDATAFHLDAGRAAVLATRHRHACVVVGRAGAAQLLEDHPPPAEYELGVSQMVEFDGWEAHSRFLEHLESVRV